MEMSDLDMDIEQEVDIESSVEVDAARSFIDALQGDNFASAETTFNDILGDKIQDALDAEKVSVADQIFNGVATLDVEEDESNDIEYDEENEYFEPELDEVEDDE